MTATNFMEEYRKFLRKDGYINLKTDSNFMYTYTLELLKINELNICENTNNLYASEIQDKNLLNIKTYYEQQWLARGLTINNLISNLILKLNMTHIAVMLETNEVN